MPRRTVRREDWVYSINETSVLDCKDESYSDAKNWLMLYEAKETSSALFLAQSLLAT